jgi:starch synthase
VKVLSVVSEIYPLVKTGGLGDVAGALPLALAEHGVEMLTLVPGYPAVMTKLSGGDEIKSFADVFGGPARVLWSRAEGLQLLVIDAPHLFNRPGTPYVTANGQDWPDNAFRFGALSWIAARFGLGDVPSFTPDIVHCHDWQAGLVPAYLAFAGLKRARTVITIHNLAYQGKFPAELLNVLRLPEESFRIDGVEYYGGIGFLKAGLQFADRITTVSPTYAVEIRTPENGLGLDGLLRARGSALSAIGNGIDTLVWDPKYDTRIPVRFGPNTLCGRAGNTTELRRRFGLENSPVQLLMGIVSRFVWQKGLDILIDAAPRLLAQGAQFAILGTGDSKLEQQLTLLAMTHPGQVGCIIGYDEELAHLVQAGADALLVPSRFEPCGMTQLCAMRYGAVPVVSKVGGLADTVADVDHSAPDTATGIHISPVTKNGLELAGQRALALWANNDQWQRIQKNGMRSDVSWKKPAEQYAKLYSDLVATKY